MQSKNVFLGTMTHDGRLDYRMARKFYAAATKVHNVMYVAQQSSLLAFAYNDLWTKALNLAQKHDLTYFAILHADINPDDFWLDKLIDLLESHNADVMSAIVPIKDKTGLTSTAISGPDNFTKLTRLTTHQVNHKAFPKTFDIMGAIKGLQDWRDAMPPTNIDWKELFNSDDEILTRKLLVNTGCFVCRIDRPWSKNVYFSIQDRIVPLAGGQLVAQVEPEDWFFSRLAAEQNARVMATTEVQVGHVGTVSYLSASTWGENNDPQSLT